jgi:hypothetical protein
MLRPIGPATEAEQSSQTTSWPVVLWHEIAAAETEGVASTDWLVNA